MRQPILSALKPGLARVLACFLSLSFLTVQAGSPNPTEGHVRIRVSDSATGQALRPEKVTLSPHDGLGTERVTTGVAFGLDGTADIPAENGRHTMTVSADGYDAITAPLQVRGGTEIRVLLDPIEEPIETRPETIESLRREGFMLIQGYVVGDALGQALEGVSVTDLGSGASSVADSRGFFRMWIPAPLEMRSDGALLVAKPGYRQQSIHSIEVWSMGDCTYRLRMKRGSGSDITDESTLRRRAPARSAVSQGEAGVPVIPESVAPDQAEESIDPPQPATLPSNATVRVPRNIRVLQGDGVTIDYVSFTYYCRAVLGSEWIASWGDIPGGTNSLNAGAVAVRCYAIAKINAASATSSYDICGTSSCQVYNPAKIHSRSDTAVSYTADWVLLNGTTIASAEYSAENNSSDPSLQYACPDGFTAPDATCLYDPICAGQARYGHGRGMCQWGTARWATGRRMNGRSSGDTTPSGFPRRDWKWLVRHYYPKLTLVKGAPLVVGDDIKALKSTSVRACPGESITNGTSCPLLATKSAGDTGVVLAGPVLVTVDGKGFTWYQVRWNDASSTTGWSVENYIERVFPTPAAPTGLQAEATSTAIQLTWADSTDVESGFQVERALSAAGPWISVAEVPANSKLFQDSGLSSGTTWFYRVRAVNSGGASGYSGTASATTVLPGPVISPLGSATIPEEQAFSRTATVTVSDWAIAFADLNPFMSETANGRVLFSVPRYSGSTSGFIDAAPNICAVTDAYPTNGHGPGLVLMTRFAVTNNSNPWLRLTTANPSFYANPVIDLRKQLRFQIFADKQVSIALGVRETVMPVGTPVGANGGDVGGIEWVGVTNKADTAPVPTRVVSANVWTTLTFDLPNEPVWNFSGGNGVLSTASGLGVLEHIAIVPGAGAGEYKVCLDNFEVVEKRGVSWSLRPGVPAGMSVDVNSGLIAWTPSEAQGPDPYSVGLVATTAAGPPISSTNVFVLNVTEVNRSPLLAELTHTNWVVHAGMPIVFTNAAIDPDLPANALTYSLGGQVPSAARVNAATGLFEWHTIAQDAGSLHNMLLQVADNGTPLGTDVKPFAISVMPVPQISAMLSGGEQVLAWEAIDGCDYQLQYKATLSDPTWAVVTNLTANASGRMSITNALAGPQGFYRVVAGEN